MLLEPGTDVRVAMGFGSKTGYFGRPKEGVLAAQPNLRRVAVSFLTRTSVGLAIVSTEKQQTNCIREPSAQRFPLVFRPNSGDELLASKPS